MINNIEDGLRIRCSADVKSQIRDVSIEFVQWLRKKNQFPIRIIIYIRNYYLRKLNKGQKFTASFFAPFNKEDKPFIRIAVGKYELKENNKDNSEILISILHSIAHEVTHYQQWIQDASFIEKEADRNSRKLVKQFLKDRGYNLSVSKRTIKSLYRADMYAISGEFDKAIAQYHSVIKLGAIDDKIYNDLAYCFDCMGKYDEAILYYDKAIYTNSLNDIAYCNKGYALYHLGRYTESIELFNKSIVINPRNKEAYVFKGNSLEVLEHYKEAVECYNKAITLKPDYDIAYNYKGQVLHKVGKYDEAKFCFIKAISIDSHYADAYYNMAILFSKLGENSNAIKYLEKAIKIENAYKHYAIDEKEFRCIKDTEEFSRIV